LIIRKKITVKKRKKKKRNLQLIPSIQVPPFSHESTSQSSILFWHVEPSKPVPVQLHVYIFTPSIQIPPFSHAPEKQSSILLSHVGPLNPGLQLHV